MEYIYRMDGEDTGMPTGDVNAPAGDQPATPDTGDTGAETPAEETPAVSDTPSETPATEGGSEDSAVSPEEGAQVN